MCANAHKLGLPKQHLGQRTPKTSVVFLPRIFEYLARCFSAFTPILAARAASKIADNMPQLGVRSNGNCLMFTDVSLANGRYKVG